MYFSKQSLFRRSALDRVKICVNTSDFTVTIDLAPLKRTPYSITSGGNLHPETYSASVFVLSSSCDGVHQDSTLSTGTTVTGNSVPNHSHRHESSVRGAHEVRHGADLALGTPVVALSEAAVADTVGCDGIHDLVRTRSRDAKLSICCGSRRNDKTKGVSALSIKQCFAKDTVLEL